MLPQVRHFLEIGGRRGLPRSFPLNFIPETKIFKLIVKNKNNLYKNHIYVKIICLI